MLLWSNVLLLPGINSKDWLDAGPFSLTFLSEVIFFFRSTRLPWRRLDCCIPVAIAVAKASYNFFMCAVVIGLQWVYFIPCWITSDQYCTALNYFNITVIWLGIVRVVSSTALLIGSSNLVIHRRLWLWLQLWWKRTVGCWSIWRSSHLESKDSSVRW